MYQVERVSKQQFKGKIKDFDSQQFKEDLEIY
jgi:hypothetical protein